MTVQDFDWAGGARLVNYQIIDDGQAYDANLRIRVKLGPGRAREEGGQGRREDGVVPRRYQPVGHGLPRLAPSLIPRGQRSLRS